VDTLFCQLHCQFAKLSFLRDKDVVCPFIRQKNVYKRFSLYGITSRGEMPASERSLVHGRLQRVRDGEIRVLVHGLTVTKSCQEIGVVGGQLSKLRIDVPRR